MSEKENRTPQEYEFIMEGITTRMQMALEKIADSNKLMADSNKLMHSAVRWVCAVSIIIVSVLGAIIMLKG